MIYGTDRFKKYDSSPRWGQRREIILNVSNLLKKERKEKEDKNVQTSQKKNSALVRLSWYNLLGKQIFSDVSAISVIAILRVS